MNNKKDNDYKNTPTKPGIYWAKSSSAFNWCNLIVEIYGEIPYLQFRYWDRCKNKIIENTGKPNFIFSNKITEPTEE